MKFCKRCAAFNRSDYLKSRHFRKCQEKLGKYESGFLKVGELPEMNEENVEIVLSMIGVAPMDAADAPTQQAGTEFGQRINAFDDAATSEAGGPEGQLSGRSRRERSHSRSTHSLDCDAAISQGKRRGRPRRSSSTAKPAS